MNYEHKLFFLLLLLVVLPCIVLSVFALQAMLGQKILIEQKIKESYTALAESIHKRVLDQVKTKDNLVHQAVHHQVWLNKEPSIPHLTSVLNVPFFKFVYITDKDYNIVYPQQRPHNIVAAVLTPIEHYNLLEPAHIYEFRQQDFAAAIREYQKIVVEEKEQKLEAVGYALIAIARCNLKANNLDKALETYQYLATLCRDRNDSQALSFMIDAKSQMAGIYQKKDTLAYYQTLLELLELLSYNEYCIAKPKYIYHYNKLTEELNKLELEQAVSSEERYALLKQREKVLNDREQMLAREKFLNQAKQYLIPRLKILTEKKRDTGYLEYRSGRETSLAYYRELQNSGEFMGHVVYEINLQYALEEIIIPILQSQGGGKDMLFTIVDRDNKPVAGAIPPQFFIIVSQPLSPVFPFWYIAVCLKNIRSLDELSRLRSQIYIGGIVVVILLFVIGMYITIATFIREIKSARLKSDFLSNISHELKTPLTSITMFVETLLMGRTSSKEEQIECLQIIAAETERLRRLIDRILSFAKMEQKKRPLHFSLQNIGKLVQETGDYFKSNQVPARGETLDTSIQVEPNLPEMFVDPEAFEEVLNNLLSNAYKYNNKQQKKIELSCKKISSSGLAISVKDNGMGIAKTELRRIFQKFYRSENPETRNIEGTGLGLALVEAIVKAHKGKIKVKSKVNIGSEFIIFLYQQRRENLPIARGAGSDSEVVEVEESS